MPFFLPPPSLSFEFLEWLNLRLNRSLLGHWLVFIFFFFYLFIYLFIYLFFFLQTWKLETLKSYRLSQNETTLLVFIVNGLIKSLKYIKFNFHLILINTDLIILLILNVFVLIFGSLRLSLLAVSGNLPYNRSKLQHFDILLFRKQDQLKLEKIKICYCF